MSPAIYSPQSSKILASLQYQEQRNDCGPFTTATVLNALRNLNISAINLADDMNRPVWRGPLFVVRRVPNWATFPWGIVDVLRSYGLQASWRLFTPKEYLRQSIGTGTILMPIIGSWKPLWAHVMTLVAWDEEMGWGFANTQYDHHNVDWHSDESFTRQWKAMGRLLIEIING